MDQLTLDIGHGGGENRYWEAAPESAKEELFPPGQSVGNVKDRMSGTNACT